MREAATETQSLARPPVLLIVEDDVLVRMMMADEFRQAGFSAVEAASGEEAAAVLESGLALDVLMTDVRLPGALDGLSLARMARAHRPDLRIIVVSDDAPEADARGLSDAFIAKPYQTERVIHCASALISGAGA
jgi:CheY-like chemotaxis protein